MLWMNLYNFHIAQKRIFSDIYPIGYLPLLGRIRKMDK